MEIRIESMNKDHSHSWVTISHGLNKLVTDLSNKTTTSRKPSEMQFEDCALKSNVLAFASRSKSKAKPRRRTPASSSTRTVHIGGKKVDWYWARRLFGPSLTQCRRKLSTLLRHGHPPRGDDGVDWILEIKGVSSERFYAISTLVWWKVEEYNGKRRRKQEKSSILYWSIRTRHSLSSELFKVIQDAIPLILHYRTMFLIPNDFFAYICAIILHSIMNSGLIPGGQNLSKRQDGILHICGSYEPRTQRSGCNWPRCTASCLVHAENVEETSKHGVLGSTSNLP